MSKRDKVVSHKKSAPKSNRRTSRVDDILSSKTLSSRGDKVTKNLRQLRSKPFSILASGIGLFYLGRYAVRYYREHPEFSEYLRENLDAAQDKFSEYKKSFGFETTEDARQ